MKNFITIGTFDGVHRGHQHLFNLLETRAALHRAKPLVLYFPLPPKTLQSPHPEMSVLTLPEEKVRLFKTMGLHTEILDFARVRSLYASQFFNRLVNHFDCGGLLIGADFAFGKNREGSAVFLREACSRKNIPFEVLSFYKEGSDKISSSLIRKLLAQGNIAHANALLGRPYELTGRVIPGHKLGRKLGYPTANLDTGIYKILPLGVFAVKVRVGTKLYDGFCNIGFRPTINTLTTVLPLVEVHIFNFKQSIYGRKITIWFYQKLRSEIKFDGLDALKAQLAQDKKQAAALLSHVIIS
ncbi:MAG: riboflavin biosynthesis protein RibF [Elusimicrobiaceae bacterium]|nr:riboflavin biosynthesis protein RibF [Elusimicrobiaceae bacterium]